MGTESLTLYKDDDYPDSYIYNSEDSVSVEFAADANAAQKGVGELKVTFNQSGAIFLAAIDCTKEKISDTSYLADAVTLHKNSLDDDWDSLFIVTALTTAKKALIMQSNSETGGLKVYGEVQGLQTNTDINIDASATVSIQTHKDSAFMKPWSDNVTVFFELLRCKGKGKNIIRGANNLSNSYTDLLDLIK